MLTDEDFGGPQGQADFVRILGSEAAQGGGSSFLHFLLKELAEELSDLNMFDEVSGYVALFLEPRNSE